MASEGAERPNAETNVRATRPYRREAVGSGVFRRVVAWSATGRRSDLFAVAFIVLVALAYLSPALFSGPSFGPADLGRGLSVLTSVAHSQIHNNINGDVIDQGVAWNTLNYQLIHRGEFPLWNVFAGNGLPQFLNFESAVLSLPSLIGYLVPLSISFTVEVLIKLLIAGLGTYWCARLLRLRPLAATLAAVTFMVSGAFSNWLGWSISGVFCWSGVILAGAVLCWRARSSMPGVAVVSISVAFAIFGGFPEGYVLLLATLLLIGLVVCVVHRCNGERLRIEPFARFVGGGLLGLGLSSPLWLPGAAVIRSSIRATADAAAGIPAHGIFLAFAQGYYGLPTSGNEFFLSRSNYYESAAYLGIVAVVFSAVAIGCRYRRPVVVALMVTAVVQLAVIYQAGVHDPIQQLVRDAGLGSIATHRLLSLLAFVMALLAGCGLDAALREPHARRVKQSLAAGLAIVGAMLAYLWTTVPSAATAGCALGSAECSSMRRSSLVGPSALWVAMVVMGLVLQLAAGSKRTSRPNRSKAGLVPAALVGAVVLQSVYLVCSGAGINTFARASFPVTPAVSSLSRLANGALVAQDGGNESCANTAPPCGLRRPTGVDLYPSINIGYGIDELGLHDPIIPKATFASWPIPDAGQLVSTTNLFNPDVNAVALARDYGVSYVLVPQGSPPPPGMINVASLANNGVTLLVYRVPKSAKVTATGSVRVRSITSTGDRTVLARLAGRGPSTITVHVTDSPGWHATLDGSPVDVARGPTNDLVVHLGATRLGSSSVLRLTYLPRDLLVGLVVAALCALALLALFVLERRGQRRDGDSPQASTPAW